jgi:Lecithin retinol acyltransferase
MYLQGEIIAVKLPFGIEHWGISTGYGTVISASMRTGLVLEESMELFSGGYSTINKGYPSNLDSSIVLAKARCAIGEKWNLFTDNCQHFATWCHENKHSPQLQWAFAGICALVAVVSIFRSK